MSWGTAGVGVIDLVEKIRNGNQACMYILPIRKLTSSGACDIAEALRENKTIVEFCASGHDIGIEGIQAFADMLKYNTTLKKICIGNSSMGDDGVSILCNGLVHNRGLVELDLEHKNFGIVGAEQLQSVIKCHPTLKVLNVSRNELNDHAVELLCQSLPCSQVKTLLLNHNSFGAAGVEALADALPNSNIFHVSMTHNDLRYGQNKLGKAITASNVSYINLEACRLSSDFTQALAEDKHLITEINLSHNDLSVDVMKHMEYILRNGSELKKINLGYNNIQDEGVLELATALQRTDRTLDLLDLSSNNLTCTSIKELFQLSNIKELRLFKNNLAAGANEVTKYLTHNTSLELLDLCANSLEGENAVCIFESLFTNTHLKVLEMGANNLKDVGRASLEQLKLKNPMLNVAVNKKGDN